MIMRINDKKSNDFNLFIDAFVNPFPDRLEDRVEIQGRNGTTLIDVIYKDREIEIKCYLKGEDIREDIRKLGAFFRQDNLKNLITFNRDEKIFYIGTFKEVKDIEQRTKKGVEFSVVFTCDPEVYLITNNAINLENIKSVDDLDKLNENDYIKSVNPY